VACRLCLILDQELANVSTRLDYPSTTKEELHAFCPAWEPGKTHAFDFVPLVQGLVQRKLLIQRARAILLVQLCEKLNPLSVDSAYHEKASFLCQIDNNFDAIAHLTLSNNFPDEPPTIIMQSVVQLIDRRPIIDVVIEYQWDPLWSIPVMVNHLIKVIRTELLEFKNKVLQQAQNAYVPVGTAES